MTEPEEVTQGGITPLPGGVSIHIPLIGTFQIWNTSALKPLTYGYGFEFRGALGFGFLGESEGGTTGGLMSTVTLQTPLGSISNSQSYGTNYAGETYVIATTFEVAGPPEVGSPNIVTTFMGVGTKGVATVVKSKFYSYAWPEGTQIPPD